MATFLRELPSKTIFEGEVLEIKEDRGVHYEVQNGGWNWQGPDAPDTWLSEHVFFVLQGQLRVYGVKEGEDVILNPGEFVHINQSYFYQLANETSEPTIIYSVFTKPPKRPKISRYSYRGTETVDPKTLEGE